MIATWLWFGVVSCGDQLMPRRISESEYRCFVPILAEIQEISAQNCFGNNHEGSIPFTRSNDNQGLVKQCSKSAVKSPVCGFFLKTICFASIWFPEPLPSIWVATPAIRCYPFPA